MITLKAYITQYPETNISFTDIFYFGLDERPETYEEVVEQIYETQTLQNNWELESYEIIDDSKTLATLDLKGGGTATLSKINGHYSVLVHNYYSVTSIIHTKRIEDAVQKITELYEEFVH